MKRILDSIRAQIVTDYLNNNSMSFVASKYHVSVAMVYRCLKEAGAQARPQCFHTRKSKIDEAFFEKVNSRTVAIVLGFVWADGYLSKRKRGGNSLAITVNKRDKDYLEWIREVMKSEIPIRTYDDEFVKFITYNTRIVQDIERLGIFQAKSLKIGFPTEEQVPHEFVNSFVQGVFEGDGCLHVCPRRMAAHVSICGTVNFNERLKEILSTLHIDSRIVIIPKAIGKNFCTLRIDKKDCVRNFMEWIYTKTPHVMQRKRDKYDEFLSRYGGDLEFIKSDSWKSNRAAKFRETRVKHPWTFSPEGLASVKASLSKENERVALEFYVKCPLGNIYHAKGVRPFCRDVGLDDTGLGKLIHKTNGYSNYKGWTLPTPEEISAARAAGTLISRLYRQPEPALTLLDPAAAPATPLAPVLPIAPPAAPTVAA